MKTKYLLSMSFIIAQQLALSVSAAALPSGPGGNLTENVYYVSEDFDSGTTWGLSTNKLSYFALSDGKNVSIQGQSGVSFLLQGSVNGLKGIQDSTSNANNVLTLNNFGGPISFKGFQVSYAESQGNTSTYKNHGSAISTKGTVIFENNQQGISFSNNSLTYSSEISMGGGAIGAETVDFNNNKGDVSFIKNSAILAATPSAMEESSGGALKVDQLSFRNLEGSLILHSNKVQSSSHAYGGAIYSESLSIDQVHGNIEFHNNEAIGTYAKFSAIQSQAKGGAILMTGKAQLSITNTKGNVSFLNNMVQLEGGLAYGGAICINETTGQLILAGNGNTVFAGNLAGNTDGTFRREAIYHNGKPSDANKNVATHLAANEGYKIEFYDGNIFKGNLVINGHDGTKEVATSGEIIFSGGDYKDASGKTIVAATGANVWTQVYQDINMKGGTMYIRDKAHIACNEYNITGGKLFVEGNSVLKVGLENNAWTGTGNINVLGGEIHAGSANSFDKALLHIDQGKINFQGYAVNNLVYYKGGQLENYQAYCGKTFALDHGLVLNATYTAGLSIDPNISVTMQDLVNVPNNMFMDGVAKNSLFTLSTLSIGDSGTLLFDLTNLNQLTEGKYWMLGVDDVANTESNIPWTDNQFALSNKNFGEGLDGYLALEKNKVVLTITSKSIPEPSSAILAVLGLGSLMIRRRRS